MISSLAGGLGGARFWCLAYRGRYGPSQDDKDAKFSDGMALS
jgi:hypothetical protein